MLYDALTDLKFSLIIRCLLTMKNEVGEGKRISWQEFRAVWKPEPLMMESHGQRGTRHPLVLVLGAGVVSRVKNTIESS